MNRKLLIAAFAVVAFMAGAASTASAHINFSLNLGGGYPGYYPDPYPDYPPYQGVDDSYDDENNVIVAMSTSPSKNGTATTTATESCTKEFGSVTRKCWQSGFPVQLRSDSRPLFWRPFIGNCGLELFRGHGVLAPSRFIEQSKG